MRIVDRSKSKPFLVLFTWLGLLSSLSAQESPSIYGIHDHDTNIQEYLDHFSAGAVRGWVTATIAIGSDPSNTGGDDFRWIANLGSFVSSGRVATIIRKSGNAGRTNTGTNYDDILVEAGSVVPPAPRWRTRTTANRRFQRAAGLIAGYRLNTYPGGCARPPAVNHSSFDVARRQLQPNNPLSNSPAIDTTMLDRGPYLSPNFQALPNSN